MNHRLIRGLMLTIDMMITMGFIAIVDIWVN